MIFTLQGSLSVLDIPFDFENIVGFVLAFPQPLFVLFSFSFSLSYFMFRPRTKDKIPITASLHFGLRGTFRLGSACLILTNLRAFYFYFYFFFEAIATWPLTKLTLKASQALTPSDYDVQNKRLPLLLQLSSVGKCKILAHCYPLASSAVLDCPWGGQGIKKREGGWTNLDRGTCLSP